MLKEITFIIKTFKRYNCLDELLKSIKAFYPEAKIIIADDSGEIDYVFYENWKNVLNIEVLYLDFDLGLSCGRNKLVKASKTPFVLLLDDDFVFYKETKIEKFYKIIKSDEKIGVVGGMCLEGKAQVEQHYEFIPKLENGLMTQIYDGDNWEQIEGIKAKKTGAVLNFGLFRKELLDSNTWDDNLKLCEHLDFYLRLSKTDWKVYYTPEVKIYHHRGGSLSYKEYRTRNHYYQKKIYDKHKIHKLIDLNGGVIEYKDDKIKRYKIAINKLKK